MRQIIYLLMTLVGTVLVGCTSMQSTSSEPIDLPFLAGDQPTFAFYYTDN